MNPWHLTVVVPALNEEASIGSVVRALAARPEVARVLVVDNDSLDRTEERARAAGAEVLREPRRGYGHALRAGIEHALASGARHVALDEADGTFDPGDLEALANGLTTHDLVLGSRTAAMGGAQGFGNRIVARWLSALYGTRACRLTDVGCTMRAFSAGAWTAMRAGVTAAGPEFSPQMIAEAFRLGLRVCELPVRYGRRCGGESKHTGSLLATSRTAWRMLRVLTRDRLRARW